MAGRGRQVAEAYIDVNGDLSSFRQDLEKGRPAVQDAADVLAKDFADEFEDRTTKELSSKWASILDAAHSGDKVDWEKAIGKFNSKDLDDARDKMRDFADEMRDFGYISDEAWSGLDDDIKNAVNSLANHRDAIAEVANEARNMKQAQEDWTAAQERWKKSFPGKQEVARLKEFDQMFALIADTTKNIDLSTATDIDWSRIKKAAGSYDEMTRAMERTISRADELGMIQKRDAMAILSSMDRYIDKEKQREIAILASKDAAKAATAENERFKKSLTGMVMAANMDALNKDFRDIATAVGTTNWSKFSQGHKTIDSMRDRLKEVTKQLRDLGQVSDQEAQRITKSFNTMADNPKKFGVELEKSSRKFRPIHWSMQKLHTSWVRMDSTVRLVLGLIAAGAGPIATLGSGLAGTITALASSVGSALGSVVPLASAFAGIGLSIGLAVSAWDGMIARVPVLQTALDGIAATWRAQAEDFGRAWEGPLRDLLVNFRREFANYDFGTPLGEAVGGITDAFTALVNGSAFSALMTAFTTDIPGAVQGFGTGLSSVFSMLMSLMAGAAPVAKLLGEDFARWGQNLANALEAGRQSGQLNDTFMQMRESLLAVLDFVGSLGMALGTMFSLGASTGNGMLNTLTGLVDKFTAWMNTDAGRQQMLDWFAQADTIIRSIGPLVEGLAVALAGLVTPASVAQFGNLMELMGLFVVQIGEILSVVSQLGIFNILFTALTTIGTAIQPLLPLLGEMAALMGPVLQGAISALGPLFSAVVAAVTPLVEAWLRVAREVAPLIVPAIQQIVAAVTPVIGVFGQLVSFIAGILAPILISVLPMLIQGVVNIFQGLSTTIMGVVAIITAVLSGLGAFFTNLFQGNIGGALSALGTMFSAVWQGILQVVGGILQALWGLINVMIVGRMVAIVRSGLTFIGALWSSIWKGIQAAVSGIISGIRAVLSGNMTAIRSTVATVLNSIRSFFSTIWNAIRSATTATVNGIRSVITSVFNAVRSFISSIMTGIRTVFVAGWNAIRSAISAAINAIRSGISAGFNAARSLVSSVMNSIRSTISSAWNSAVSLVRSAMSNFSSAVSSGVNNVMGFIRSLPGRISGALSGLGGLLSGAGSAIINGFLGGLKAAWGGVTDFVGGIASWIRDNKGPIAYDRKLLIPAGTAIMQGLDRGLESQMPSLKRTLDGVTGLMSDSITESLSQSKMYAQGKMAATGLADGLTANKGSIKSAMAGLGSVMSTSSGTPTVSPVRASATRETATGGSSKSVVVEKGAVQITTPTKNPELVANKVIDGFADYSMV